MDIDGVQEQTTLSGSGCHRRPQNNTIQGLAGRRSLTQPRDSWRSRRGFRRVVLHHEEGDALQFVAEGARVFGKILGSGDIRCLERCRARAGRLFQIEEVPLLASASAFGFTASRRTVTKVWSENSMPRMRPASHRCPRPNQAVSSRSNAGASSPSRHRGFGGVAGVRGLHTAWGAMGSDVFRNGQCRGRHSPSPAAISRRCRTSRINRD